MHHLTISKCTCGFDLAFLSCVKFQECVIYNEKSLKFIGPCLMAWYIINVYKYSMDALKMCVLQFLGKMFNTFPLDKLLVLLFRSSVSLLICAHGLSNIVDSV